MAEALDLLGTVAIGGATSAPSADGPPGSVTLPTGQDAYLWDAGDSWGCILLAESLRRVGRQLLRRWRAAASKGVVGDPEPGPF